MHDRVRRAGVLAAIILLLGVAVAGLVFGTGVLRGFGALGVIRNSVRPGLTGWAQVSGNTRLNDDEKLALDLWYVAHRSPGLDLRILWDTLGVALRGEHRHEERLRRAQAWLRDQQTAVPPEMEMAGAMS